MSEFFVFANPYILLLLLLLAAVLFFYWKKPLPSIVFPSLLPFRGIKSGGKRRFPFRKFLPFFFYAFAAGLLIFALARPRSGMEEIKRRTEGVDIMIALDLSMSMSAYDLPQGLSREECAKRISNGILLNRLETAKKEIRNFILARPNDRIGLIAFAPMPYVACPPTLDHPWLLAHLQSLTLGMVGDGTGIAGPIASGVKRLQGSDSKRKVLVLFTDGRNNIHSRLTPLQAAETADTLGVTVYTVGIGSSSAAIIQQGLFGNSLQMVQGEFDEPLLRSLAEKTKGVYYHASDEKTMKEAMKEIDRLEKTPAEQEIHINWAEYYPTLSLLALLSLAMGFLLENSFCRRLV